MLKNNLLIILFCFSTFLSADDTFSSYPKRLENVVQTIRKLPEGRQLIEEATKEGPIRLTLFNDARFGACWNNEERYIAVDAGINKTIGNYINSIVFELHNAKNDHKLERLYQLAVQRNISKEAFVEQVERVEYDNALEASIIVDKGIKQKIFPKDSEWMVFRSFEDHYCVQQITGHSQQIAESYDHLYGSTRSKPYIGTLGKFNQLTQENKEDLIRYFHLKNDCSSSDPEESALAEEIIHKEYTLVKSYYSKRKRARDNLFLMETVFGKSFLRAPL